MPLSTIPTSFSLFFQKIHHFQFEIDFRFIIKLLLFVQQNQLRESFLTSLDFESRVAAKEKETKDCFSYLFNQKWMTSLGGKKSDLNLIWQFVLPSRHNKASTVPSVARHACLFRPVQSNQKVVQKRTDEKHKVDRDKE